MHVQRACEQCGAKHDAKGLCLRWHHAHWRREQPERARAAQRTYQERHHEEKRERSRAYRAAHRVEISA
jgi:hypothetical protein